MATVNEQIARGIIAKDGWYMDDPRVRQVIKYKNSWGGESWAILYEQDVNTNRYAASDSIVDPQIIWEAKKQWS